MATHPENKTPYDQREYAGHDAPVDQIMPDFECAGCGRGFYQNKEPVHCSRCKGTAFVNMQKPPAGIGELDQWALRRTRRELEIVERRLAARKLYKGQVMRRIRQACQRIDEAIVELAGSGSVRMVRVDGKSIREGIDSEMIGATRLLYKCDAATARRLLAEADSQVQGVMGGRR